MGFSSIQGNPRLPRKYAARCALHHLEWGSKRLERDDRVRVGDLGDDLDVFGDEVADIDAVIHVELGEDVVIARRRVDLGGDLPVGESVRDGVGLAELALDLDEEGLHGALRSGGRLESGVRRYGTRP